jgi:16S rRNA processing protein RimM
MRHERVVVAELRRPRGNRGELTAHLLTDVPDRLRTLERAYVHLRDGSDVPVEITEAWPHKGDWVVKFRGVDSIDAAEKFRAGDLWVPFEERGLLAPGEFFQSDLVGCTVVTGSGEAIGVLERFEQCGEAPPLMVINGARREVLVPFVRQQCRVDLNTRQIRVELPEGLLDL